MIRRLVFASLLFAGCDRSAVLDDCLEEQRCVPSVFKDDGKRGEIAGTVWLGENGVPGARVRIDAPKGGRPFSTVSDPAGFFKFTAAPDPYDLTVAFDANVLAYRGVRARVFDPSIEPPTLVLPKSWPAHFDVRLETPLGEGHAIAFFASGDGVYGATGDLASGATIFARDYARPADLHAVEYDPVSGFISASAYATAKVITNAGATQLVSLRLAPLASFGEPTILVAAPPGMTPDAAVDLVFGYSRTSGALLARIGVGVKTRVPYIPGTGVGVLARATGDGTVSESGEQAFDLFAKTTTTVTLPAPPSAMTPLDGETRGANELLVAARPTSGILEHVLEGPGATIRIVTDDSETKLPSAGDVGLAAAGTYTWTVRHYPKYEAITGLTGSAPRRYSPSARSKPRTLTLR